MAVLGIFLFELVGLVAFKNFYNWDYRYLFIGEHNFRWLDDRLWTYEPNSNIRTASAYGFGIFGPWVESACSWKTNEFGLINTTQGTPRVADVLVLGDSFTEGEGGCPWLTEQTLSHVGATVLNGGLGGTSITQFRLLEQFLAKQLEIKNVFVVAISQDFFRNTSSKFITAETACLRQFSCGSEDYTWAIREQEWSDVLSLTTKRIKQRYPLKRRWRAFLEWHSISVHLVAQVLRREGLLDDSQLPHESRDLFLEHNMSELSALKQEYPGMRVILIPQRDEVGLFGRKNADSKVVELRLKSLAIDYERCEIGAADYMYIDGHPNRKGYEKIFACLFGNGRL